MQKESRKSLKIEEVIAVVYSPLKHWTSSNNNHKFSLYFKGNVSWHYKKYFRNGVYVNDCCMFRELHKTQNALCGHNAEVLIVTNVGP